MADDSQSAEINQTFTMREVSRELGIKSRVLRSYCDSGLVTGVVHMFGRGRAFTAEQIGQLKMAYWLSQAGFTKKDLRKYALLMRRDDQESTQKRIEMLKTHKRQVWQKLEDLQATIDFLERQEDLAEK